MTTKSVRIFVLGFFVIFLMALALAVVGVLSIRDASHRLESVVSINMKKLSSVRALNSIARQRQGLLIAIAKENDDFARDELVLQFNTTGVAYDSARQDLEGIGIDENERSILQEQLSLSRQIVPQQLEAIDLFIKGDKNAGEQMLFDSILENQSRVLGILDKLMIHIEADTSRVLREGTNEHLESTRLLFGLITLAALVVAVVAILAIRKISGALKAQIDVATQLDVANSALRGVNITLEERVAERTASLNQTVTTLQQEMQQRREAEKEKNILEKYLVQHIKQTPLAVIELSTQGNILEWNPAAEKIFEYSRDEAHGKKIAELLVNPEHKELVDTYWQQLLTGESVIATQEASTKTGKQIDCDWIVTPILENDGNINRIFCLAQDVTARRQMERAQEEFIAVVSHELRTPLTAMRAALGLLNNETSTLTEEQNKKMLMLAVQSSDRLTTLINDILDYEKLALDKMHFDMEAIDIRELIEQVVNEMQSYATQNGVKFSYVPSIAPLLVYGDKKRLVQVLMNLTNNAIKFSPRDGAVTITHQYLGNRLRIGILDQAGGVPLEYQSQMFTKFTQADSSSTRKKGGTGLGLAICKAIVEKLGGTIAFETEIGKGSFFYFDLPYLQQNDKSAAA